MPSFINIPSPHGNVAFNFTRNPIRDLTAFAKGYQEAARFLAERFGRQGYRDYEGYPILYLYRHSLELYLKAIVYRGAVLMRFIGENGPDPPGLFKRHELGRLIPAARAIFESVGWDFGFEGSPFASFNEFDEFVRNLDSIDPGSYSFRYPINRAGHAQLPHHLTINVVAFGKTMDTLLECLEDVAARIEDNWDTAVESARDVQQYLAEDSGP